MNESTPLTPLEAAGGAEFLAGVELLDAAAIAQTWWQGQFRIGERQRDAFLSDLQTSGQMLLRHGPLVAAADHGRRRFEHLLHGFSESQQLNAECMSRLVRLHRSFAEAFSTAEQQ